MKFYTQIIAAFLSLATYGQIPANYYSTATGTGFALKTQLHNIIKGHTDLGYAALYTTYQSSDIDSFYENDGTILDMYSENPSGNDPYNYSVANTQRCGNYTNEGDCYNREHIIPQSIFGEASPMVSDAHFITPTDGKVNGIRSNFPHGTVANTSLTTLNGGKLGTSGIAGYSGSIFEPIDDFKGDIARMYFYFATRYENTVSGYSYAMFNGTENQVFTTNFLNLLLSWHAQDPVSQREIIRNNSIHLRQNNRNPFIDHPEYVLAIWNPNPDTQAPTAATNLAVTTIGSNSVSLIWTAATDDVSVTNYKVYVNNVLATTVSSTTATINNLSPETNYSFYVIAQDAALNASSSSNNVNATTSVAIVDAQIPSTPSNLITGAITASTVALSWTASTDNVGVVGYDVYLDNVLKTTVTGTSTIINLLLPTTAYSFYVIAKDAASNTSLSSNLVSATTLALSATCANESFESMPANASNYATRTWTGDSGLSWTALDARTDQTLTTRAICLRGNLSASESANGIGSLTVRTQLKFSGSPGTFTVNVNGTAVGTIPYSATATTTTINDINIKGNVTVSFTNNSTSTNRVAFDDVSWTCYSEMGLSSYKKTGFTVYPNPSKGNFSILLENTSTPYTVFIYNMLGDLLYQGKTINSNTVVFNAFQSGVYLIKLEQNENVAWQKIVVN